MTIKTELLKSYISHIINDGIVDFEINASEVADSTAITMLGEIQEIIKDHLNSDFDAIEKIVCVFEKYNLDFGVRHDFV